MNLPLQNPETREILTIKPNFFDVLIQTKQNIYDLLLDEENFIENEEFNQKKSIYVDLIYYKWMDLQQTYDYFSYLKASEIRQIEINWKKLSSIKSTLTPEFSENILLPNNFLNWIDMIFEWTWILNKSQKLIKDLQNYKGNHQESYDYFSNFTFNDMQDFKFNWLWVSQLRNITKFESNLNIFSQEWFNLWLDFIFNWTNVIKLSIKQKLISSIKNYNKMTELDSKIYLKSLKNLEFKHIDFDWIWLYKANNILWVELQNNIFTKKWFHEFLDIIYDIWE